jgi:hypothetical protein
MKLILKIQHMNFKGKFVVVEYVFHQTKSNQMDECDFVKWNKINLTNVVEMDFDDMTKCHVNLQGGCQPSKVQRNLPHVNLANSKSK